MLPELEATEKKFVLLFLRCLGRLSEKSGDPNGKLPWTPSPLRKKDFPQPLAQFSHAALFIAQSGLISEDIAPLRTPNTLEMARSLIANISLCGPELNHQP